MMKYLRSSIFLMIISLTVIIAGCGGGGGGYDIAANWPAYTPPPAVADGEEQADFAGAQVAMAIQEVKSVSELNPWQMSDASIDALVALASHIAGELGLTAADVPISSEGSSPVTGMAALAIYLAEQMPKSEDEVRPAETYPLNWDSGDIHWEGSVVTALNSVNGSIHGAGPDTDVDIDISGTIGLTSAHAIVTVGGYITCTMNTTDWDGGVEQACVGVPGRATLDEDISVTVQREGDEWTDFSGLWDMNDQFAVYESEQWVTKNKIEGTHDISGTILEEWALTFEADLDYYFGVLAGEDFLWAHHDGNVAGAFDSDHNLESFSLVQDMALSNGMSAHIEVATSWDLSGQLTDAEEQLLATLTGNLQGGTACIDWVDGRPDQMISW